MKKIISLILSVMMVASMLSFTTLPASADDATTGEVYQNVTMTLPVKAGKKPKHFTYTYTNNVTQECKDSFFTINNSHAADGNNSVELTYLDSDRSWRIRTYFPIKTGAPVGTYTLSWKSNKKLVIPQYEGTITLTDGSGSALLNSKSIHNMTPSGPDDSGWYTYTITEIDASASGPSAMNIFSWLVEQNSNILVDDFKLIKDGDATNTNYIINGSFEDVELDPLPKNTLPVGAVAYGNDNVQDAAVANYYTVSSEAAYESDYSVKVYLSDGWSAKSAYLDLPLVDGELAQSVDAPYTLSFNIKKTGIANMKVNPFGGSNLINLQSAYYTEILGDGWNKYTLAGIYANESISKIQFELYGPTNMYIDNLSLKGASGKEYVANGGFEEYTEYDYTIQPVKYDASTNTATVYAANNKLENNLNLTLITVINPLKDVKQISAAALGTASIAKNSFGKATATLTQTPGEDDAVRSFVWDSVTLTPYYEDIEH